MTDIVDFEERRHASYYTYDAEGNEVGKVNIATGEHWTYGYDNANHLVHAEQRTASGTLELSATYKYDAFGNRVEKDVTQGGATTVTKFAMEGWNPAKSAPLGNENWDVWADLSATGSLTTHYVRGDAVDQLFAQVGATGAASWLETDYLGSVRGVIGIDGVVRNQIDYDAWGNVIRQTNSAFGSRYGWTGREKDVETGLQYNRARYYDASVVDRSGSVRLRGGGFESISVCDERYRRDD